jgi:eukaryotic-like serine/threonine-protein kinase
VIGEVVGGYRVVAKLGEGGMGEVYLAQHQFIARRAAIKFLLPELSNRPDMLSRFFGEARAASSIDHPGIVEVFDCQIHTDGRAYLVMQALHGESLGAYLRRVGPFASGDRAPLGIVRQLATVIAAAHDQGIVHRDLKPDNIFLHVGGRGSPTSPIVKILDFGVAKLVGPTSGLTTLPGNLIGTPFYMSPEQCRSSTTVDLRSDVYSFGCILFELTCGRQPFIDEGLGDIILAHVTKPPPDLDDLAPAVLPATKRLVEACLAKDPSDRPQSMQEVIDLLDGAGAADPSELRQAVVPPTSLLGGELLSPSPATPPNLAARAVAPTTPMALSALGIPTPSSRAVGGTKVLPPTGTLAHAASEVERIAPVAAPRGRAVAWGLAVLAVGGAVVFLTLRQRSEPAPSDAKRFAISAPPTPAVAPPPPIAPAPSVPEHPAASALPAHEAQTDTSEGHPPQAAASPPTKRSASKRPKGHNGGHDKRGEKAFEGFDDL